VFYCAGDVPAGWTLERPLPGEPVADPPPPPKNKGGRPRKVVPDA
jgi:hypothetical protein